ncbi:flagellin N-terminal helical domain-containing protein [Mangrovihabitans endophyticus]|uniref:Flagellin n=1 Tax=Mangrovihabitans endophyticus TaxID=1751298 RepID=A0A8J3BYB6_9ACTN|nr:flagellin [Mangrovihabitans endophyticus]GGK82996.1 flagellin [Mangrovihabitans endophyticus]
MGLRINQNIAAQNAYRNLSVTDNQMSKSLEKLSSGYRINRAADDAAGLSISEGLRSQIGGLKVAVRNAQDGISVTQTAEGALNEVTSILQRMRDLSVQAANGGSTDSEAAAAAQKEFSQLNSELDRIGSTTAFGKSKLLDGSFGTTQQVAGTKQTTALPTGNLAFDITTLGGVTLGTPIAVTTTGPGAGASAAEVVDSINTALDSALKAAGYNGNEVRFAATVADDGSGYTFEINGTTDFVINDNGAGTGLDDLGLGTGAQTSAALANGHSGQFQVGANKGETLTISIGAVSAAALGTNSLDLTSDPDGAIEALDSALQQVSDQRAELGAYQNRFEHTINNLNVSVENLSASESRIRDTDMAQEMVAFTRNQILTQAGTSMLSQANQASQNVLSLLR